LEGVEEGAPVVPVREVVGDVAVVVPAVVADPVGVDEKDTGLGVADPVAEIPATQRVSTKGWFKTSPTYH